MGATIIDRLAAGKGDDAVVLQTLLVIWVQGWVSCTGPEGIGITYTKQRRHPGIRSSEWRFRSFGRGYARLENVRCIFRS